jgi:hypothetical protein
VTIIGLVGAAALKVDALLRRAAAEEELLDIGAAFSAALAGYAAVTPKGQPALPPTLQALLKDPRSPSLRRHLRKIFVDPLTGKAEWGIVYVGDHTGVAAVYSLSDAKPLKVANFDARFQNFENKERISDWKFTANGQGITPPGRPVTPPEPAPQAPPGPAAPEEPPQPPGDQPPPAQSNER